MKEFKVGDRVRVYGNTQTGALEKNDIKGFIGNIITAWTDGWIQVNVEDSSHDYTVHPKQCRRLKARAKPRECWVNPSIVKSAAGATICGEMYLSFTPKPDWIAFKEVRKVKP